MLLRGGFRRDGYGCLLNGARLGTRWTRLGSFLERDGEAEAAGNGLLGLWRWLARLSSAALRPLPPLLLILQIHQPQPVRQRVKTRAPLEDGRRGGPRSGARVRREARLLAVLPAVEGLVAGVGGRAGPRGGGGGGDGAAAGPAVGGDAAACGGRVLGVGAGEEGFGGVGDKGHCFWSSFCLGVFEASVKRKKRRTQHPPPLFLTEGQAEESDSGQAGPLEGPPRSLGLFFTSWLVDEARGEPARLGWIDEVGGCLGASCCCCRGWVCVAVQGRRERGRQPPREAMIC